MRKRRAELARAVGDPRAAARTGTRERGPTPVKARKSRLWWWVVVAFIVQCAAWAAWFKIAASAHVQDVPLATAENR